jgi:hypothetical protein
MTSVLKKADPDWFCLPFWVGFLINFSQFFIYALVIANYFVHGDLPANADRVLRMAQVRR